jgi:hypothetical protein
VDPVERILNHNSELQKIIAGGSRGTIALDFQQRYEALERTNSALTVQLQRLNAEHHSMAHALTEANKKIHEQQVQLARCQPASERTKDEELQLTLSHFREQNRVLVQQVSELSTLLARGLTEHAARIADLGAGAYGGDGVGVAAQSNESGARLITRFLDSTARHTLCPNCILNVTRYRDKLVGPLESNVGRLPNPNSIGGFGGGDAPSYKPVADLTQPPPTQYYNDQYSSVGRSASHQPSRSGSVPAGGATFGNTGFTYGIPPAANAAGYAASTGGVGGAQRGGEQQPSPAVMYGGFVVRNARAPGF